jgi:exopolyphosphatase/guanosine-5'-triphosphate,3'-diphosphate pyrophosphatase
VIDAFSRIVRLGEGMGESGQLTEAAMNRTLEALKVCAKKMRRRGVTRARAVATEACRRASNCGAFLTRVERETGIRLEIITNSEEASLAIFGCAPLLDREVPNALVFDIGGGSTEVTWFDVAGIGKGRGELTKILREAPERALLGWHSVPLGVVTLAERYGGQTVTPEIYDGMVTDMRDALQDFETRHGLGALIERGELQMLGTSGTVTTLAGVHSKLPRYDRSVVDGSYLDFPTVREISRRIAAMSYEERAASPCIGRERADLVVAGCAILEALCGLWPVGRLRVADRGLREGILFTLMHDRPRRRGPRRRPRRHKGYGPNGHARPA